MMMTGLLLASVADPGFPRGGGANSLGGRQHTILPHFPKNCMKLKEFGPPGGARPSRPPLDPPLSMDTKVDSPTLYTLGLKSVH